MKRFKKTFKIFGLFFTISSVPVKMRQYRKDGGLNIDGTFAMKRIREIVIQRQRGACYLCGRQDVKLECHHILPIGRFPQLWDNKDNCVGLCKNCHAEIHHNPFSNARMMQVKAAELGLDLCDKYNL